MKRSLIVAVMLFMLPALSHAGGFSEWLSALLTRVRFSPATVDRVKRRINMRASSLIVALGEMIKDGSDAELIFDDGSQPISLSLKLVGGKRYCSIGVSK